MTENLPLTTWGSNYLQKIEEARAGLNVGFDNGMPGLSKYLYGTHVGRYYLIGAESGAGKTTIADFMYIIKLYMACKLRGIKLHMVYYSFEISKDEKVARLISLFIQMRYGVDLPSDYIRGRIEGRMVTAEHMLLIQGVMPTVDEIVSNIHFVEDAIHPTKMFHDIIEHIYEKIGTVTRAASKDKKKKGAILAYKRNPGHEQDMVVSMVDHLALAASEQGLDTKHTMDLWSRYVVTLRNIFGHTAVIIQQFNTELTSVIRMQKKGDGLLAPQRIDFGDSRYTYRDADVVMCYIKPRQYDVSTFKGYDVLQLREYLIAAYIMKNRWGAAGKCIPLFLNPIGGLPEDLPLTPSADIAMQPYYDKANALDMTVQAFIPQTQSITYANHNGLTPGCTDGTNHPVTEDSDFVLVTKDGQNGHAIEAPGLSHSGS